MTHKGCSSRQPSLCVGAGGAGFSEVLILVTDTERLNDNVILIHEV